MDKVLEQEEVLERLCGLFPYVMRLMKIMGVDENDVEDVAMEVFIDAFRGLHTLSSPETVSYTHLVLQSSSFLNGISTSLRYISNL